MSADDNACALDRAFWRERRVLLTGHTGFKGGWLALWLEHLGAVTAGYALAPSTRPNLFEAAMVDRSVDSIVADLSDLDWLRATFAAHRPDVVIHLAAQSLVRAGYADPVGTYATNVMGTVNVLEAARATPSVRSVLVVTSDKCYAERESGDGYVESDRLGGADPYSASKACAEIVSASYRQAYFHDREVEIATARAGNVIGGGDWAEDRLVPDMVRALAARERARIRNPRSVRPWQHVLEPLHGYLLLCERLAAKASGFDRAWNFGPLPDDARDVGYVADRFCARWGTGAGWTHTETAGAPRESAHLSVDAGGARAHLGWRMHLGLDEAIDWTAGWYERFAAGADARTLTLDQIERYEALAS